MTKKLDPKQIRRTEWITPAAVTCHYPARLCFLVVVALMDSVRVSTNIFSHWRHSISTPTRADCRAIACRKR